MNRRHISKENETEPVVEYLHECQDNELLAATNSINSVKYVYELFEKGCDFIYDCTMYIINISGIYIVWILLHYIASHLYTKLCVPNTIYGFVMSPFMVTAPHCQGLRWIVYNGSNIITNMWVILGTWLCSVLVINKNKNK
jgi:hypothetical protein